MDGEKNEAFRWTRPEEVMKLHQLKKKKKALQARINPNKANTPSTSSQNLPESIKRQNPFATNSSCKRMKKDYNLDTIEDSDNTIFKLLHCTSQPVTNKENRTSFANILSQPSQVLSQPPQEPKPVEVVRGETWMPIDWTLKTKVRFLSTKPLSWSQKKKISEEASALTGFSRCLDTSTTTTSLDTSSNAKFHQCCLFWQQPCLPWLQLFPRTSLGKMSNNISSFVTNQTIKDSLHLAYTDGLKSLFQLLRTRQCAYFYVCTNTFTVLFRAAGIGGFGEMHAMVTPTTRGFRQVLRQEDIEFKLPFKKGRTSDQGSETLDSISNFASKDDDVGDGDDLEDDMTDEQWLKDMGIQSEDIKKINFTQERIQHKVECEVDNSTQSLVFIEGIEVPSFFNFLMHCKSIIPQVGPLAGVPPTLLAPVAFNGASVNSLRVRENKVHIDNENFFSLELAGPILPHMIHNLYHLCQPEENVTASFTDLKSTQAFSKMKFKGKENTEADDGENLMTRSGSAIFKKENLADCGFSLKVLESFCNEEPERVTNYECLKFCNKLKLYNWL